LISYGTIIIESIYLASKLGAYLSASNHPFWGILGLTYFKSMKMKLLCLILLRQNPKYDP